METLGLPSNKSQKGEQRHNKCMNTHFFFLSNISVTYFLQLDISDYFENAFNSDKLFRMSTNPLHGHGTQLRFSLHFTSLGIRLAWQSRQRPAANI